MQKEIRTCPDEESQGNLFSSADKGNMMKSQDRQVKLEEQLWKAQPGTHGGLISEFRNFPYLRIRQPFIGIRVLYDVNLTCINVCMTVH